MSVPKVAIVGRPNVGKSSLLNRLAGRRVSIVDPTPGVTRDRVTTLLEIAAPRETPKGTPGKTFELIDTGGYGVYTAEGRRHNEVGEDLAMLTPQIESQIHVARDEAALVLFMLDAQAGITALDERIARLLREKGSAAKVIPVANKVDGEEWLAHGLEVAGLGFGEPQCISATTGAGVRDLLEIIYERLEETPEQTPDSEMRLAIVGKRNAGKSTLLNALAGEPRAIVSAIAGTTRDSIDVRVTIDGRSFVAIDTAGVRKRKSFADDIEYYAYHRMLAAIRRADVTLLLLDATTEVSQVDKKLALELQRQFKPTAIVVNKWDLVEERLVPEDYLRYLTEQLRGLDYAPIVFLSAVQGDGMVELAELAFTLYEQAGTRVSTGELNRVIESILEQRGPSSRLGTQAKLYYASQVDVRPPTITLKVNKPDLFAGGYAKYLVNRLREELPFGEIPFRLVFSERERSSVDEMKRRGRAKRSKTGGSSS